MADVTAIGAAVLYIVDAEIINQALVKIERYLIFMKTCPSPFIEGWTQSWNVGQASEATIKYYQAPTNPA